MTPCACLRLCCFRQNQPTRNFVFGRRNGQWVINGKLTPRRRMRDCAMTAPRLACSWSVRWCSGCPLACKDCTNGITTPRKWCFLICCRAGETWDTAKIAGTLLAEHHKLRRPYAVLSCAELSATPRVMRAGQRVPSWQLQSWQVPLAMAGTPTCMRTALESCQAAWRRAHVSPPSSMTFDNSPHQDTFKVVESAWF